MQNALTIAVQFIAEREGFRSEPYQDTAGVWTIGYGFTYMADGSKVTKDTLPISEDDARTRLASIVSSVMQRVETHVTVPITEHQLAALTSFAYNLGTFALQKSHLLALLNSKNYSGAADEFMRWVYAGNAVSKGLVNRREAEKALFLTPDTEQT